jgi:hypothetical protein
MDHIWYAPTSNEDFKLAEDKAIAELSAPGAEGNRSLTVIDTNPFDDASPITIYTRQWNPMNRIPGVKFDPISRADIADLTTALPKGRMRRLPPLHQGGEQGHYYSQVQAPYTGLHFQNDIIIFSPAVLQIMEFVQGETGFDFESVLKDLDATYNRDEATLSRVSQQGLGETGQVSEDARRAARELKSQITSAYWQIMNHGPDEVEDSSATDLLQDLVDEVTVKGRKQPSLMREQGVTIDSLLSNHERFIGQADQATRVSHDAFDSVIGEQGIGMPSIYGNVDDAIGDVGFDSRLFLGL